MLAIKEISKKYITGDLEQIALDKVSLNLRENEFVAILGPSGSGKTTLLNIIGGLDRYDSGDLIINGISTSKYKDKDWDSYRNHTIGFVFQSYNLIPHQTILSNVELALTISGVSQAERKKRALEALEKVGLGNQGHKKPNQLSGGQMQRVAIARALVNNPDILLADEPTGALDSKTSVQIMELLKEVAGEKLVVMVTHNPELAEEYATRIINLKDGKIISDTDPVVDDTLAVEGTKPPRTKLGFMTALSLSLNNLLTKKGRTALTSFAGSIGIIGIALILALSNGVNDYIKTREAEMLGSYPVELTHQTYDMTGLMAKSQELSQKRQEEEKKIEEKDPGILTSNNVVADSVKTTRDMVKTNDLGSFKTYLEKHQSFIEPYITGIEYKYDLTPLVYRKDKKEGIVKVSPSTIKTSSSQTDYMTSMVSSTVSSAWSQMVTTESLRKDQYELMEGKWPKAYNEVALIMTSGNEVSDYTLYTLGLMDISQMNKIIKAAEHNKKYTDKEKTFHYKDAIGLTYRVFAPAQLYKKTDNVYVDQSEKDDYIKKHFDEAVKVKITCVLKAKKSAAITSGVGYDASLVKYLLDKTYQTDVVKAQLKHKKTNVLTGKKFSDKNATVSVKDKPIIITYLAPVMLGSRTIAKVPAVLKEDEPTDSSVIDPSETKTYTVRFLDPSGNMLSEAKTYEEGAVIDNLPSTDPTKPSTKDYTYTFIGWSSSNGSQYFKTSDLPPVTQDVDYTAVFLEVAIPKQEDPGKLPGMPDKLPDGYVLINQKQLEKYVEKQVRKMLKKYAKQLNIDPKDMESYAKKYMEKYMKQYMAQYMAQYMKQLKGSYQLNLTDEQLQALMSKYSNKTPKTYDEVMTALGYYKLSQPSSISIYPKDFDGKEAVVSMIGKYNDQVKKSQKVTYTDYIKTITSSITEIIDTISYILIAFVAVSLVVSSIMIAIITYISVLERTKEIGILRALGSSKNDISAIFNAETFIEGLISGIMGIVASLLLCVPINKIAYNVAGVSGIAKLPALAAIILILISVILTFIAGFIPARIASKKDPVTALRTE